MFLKRAGLESSGQVLISLNSKTKRILSFYFCERREERRKQLLFVVIFDMLRFVELFGHFPHFRFFVSNLFFGGRIFFTLLFWGRNLDFANLHFWIHLKIAKITTFLKNGSYLLVSIHEWPVCKSVCSPGYFRRKWQLFLVC